MSFLIPFLIVALLAVAGLCVASESWSVVWAVVSLSAIFMVVFLAFVGVS